MALRLSSRTWFEIALVLIVAAVSIYAHVTLGYVCPLPWPDESHFLWPAISLAEHGTLQADELNPDRSIYWMPPGYMTVMGGMFAITGGSLHLARACSLVCVLLGFIVFLKLLRQKGCSILSSIIAGWFFLNAYFIACGNVARMEAMLLLISLTAFKLILDRRTLAGIALALMAPLIHPNGIYLALAVLVYAAVEWRRTRTAPLFTRSGVAALAAALVAWLAYAYWIAQDWSSFQQDMQFQMARKLERKILGLVPTWDNLVLIVLLLAAIAAAWKLNRSRLALLTLAIPFWWMHIIGFEMWYYLFAMMASLIVTILFVESVREFLQSRLTNLSRITRWTLTGIAVCGVLGWHLYRRHLESPINYPYRMQFFETTTPDGVPYLTASDKSRVSDIIAKESASRPITVQFFPRAEALLYLNVRSDRVKFSDPLFYSRPADLYIFHESKYLPPRWLRFLAADMTEAGLNPAERGRFVTFERDSHERWYVYRPTR